MDILAMVGSRRKQGNTSGLVEAVLAPARERGAQVEVLFLGDFRIEACTGCEGCSGSWQCVIEDDFQALVERLDRADGLVLASPTYWYTVTSDMKRFVDRCYSLIRFPETRRAWIGKYQGTNKVCVTAAVCEQPDPALAGNTLPLLSDFARDIGLDVVATVQAAGFFAAGSLRQDPAILDQARQAGAALCRPGAAGPG